MKRHMLARHKIDRCGVCRRGGVRWRPAESSFMAGLGGGGLRIERLIGSGLGGVVVFHSRLDSAGLGK